MASADLLLSHSCVGYSAASPELKVDHKVYFITYISSNYNKFGWWFPLHVFTILAVFDKY